MKRKSNRQPDRAARIMRLAVVILAIPGALPGCGGYSQNDMRKYAIKRPSDDDDAPAPRPQATSPPAARVTSATEPSAAPPEQPAQPEPAAGLSPSRPVADRATPDATAPSVASDTLQFDPSLTPVQRRQMTLDHLQRIGQALEAYVTEKGLYPSHAIYSPGGRPLLSWRVELLPYLGYEPLYRQFRQDEPWDSPLNQRLLSAIPSVFQSPERCDTKTNYLVPFGSPTAFSGRQARPPRRWEDHAENTLLVLEVDDEFAIPWTQPEDLKFNSADPWYGLQKLREDGCFAVFGGGRVARIPRELDPRVLRGLFTIDGGESVLAGAVTEPAIADLATGSPSSPLESSGGPTQVAGPSLSSSQTGVGSASHFPVAESSTNELSGRARSAAEVGRESDAIRFCHAAYLVGEAGTSNWFYWVPGLRRPAIGVRIGVGLDYVGTDRQQVDRLATSDNTPWEWPEKRAALEPIVGELGGPVLEVLDNTPRFLPPPLTSAAPTARNARTQTAGLSFLGVADQRTLEQVARRELIDCLVVFLVEQRTPRRGKDYKVASFRVLDTFARRPLYESDRISYLRREQSLRDPLFKDPIDDVVFDLEELVAKQLQPNPIPSQLQPAHASRRVQQLSRVTDDLQLLALSEMRFYQRSNLVSLQDLLIAFQTVTDENTGLTLLAGSPSAKRDLLDDWLPSVRLTATAVPRPRAEPDDE